VAELPPGVAGNYRIEPPGSWPEDSWERADAPEGLGIEPLFDELFVDDGPLGTTHAALIILDGKIIAERYHGELGSFIGDPTPVTPSTPLLSWSMAKSILGIVVAQLVTEGVLDLDAPARVPEWANEGDPRGAITLRDLMEMRDGLAFAEEYTDAGASDVIEMLFGAGKSDMAHFAADRPLAHEPGSTFNYSSGTSNIIARIVGDALGGHDGMAAALANLFSALSMASATPTFDDVGTFVASSYVHATAEDYARFGLMLLQGGVANGTRLVPESWIDAIRTPVSYDEEDGTYYSRQFWVVGDDLGTFWCSGFEGQMISVCPPLDLLIVRLGQTPNDNTNLLKEWRNRVTASVRRTKGL